MPSPIQRGTYVLGVLAVVGALTGGTAQVAAAQEQQSPAAAAQPSALTKHEEELARIKKHQEEQQQQQQPHVPEIDGASIPTALALLGAGVVMLRARLRSK